MRILVILAFACLTRIGLAAPIVEVNPIIESQAAVLYAWTHFDELLSACDGDLCHFSALEKQWLVTLRELGKSFPEIIFRTKNDLGERRFLRLPIENQVWINLDLLCQDKENKVALTIADAVSLWMDILLEAKDIPKPILALMEFELEAKLNNTPIQQAPIASNYAARKTSCCRL